MYVCVLLVCTCRCCCYSCSHLPTTQPRLSSFFNVPRDAANNGGSWTNERAKRNVWTTHTFVVRALRLSLFFSFWPFPPCCVLGCSANKSLAIGLRRGGGANQRNRPQRRRNKKDCGVYSVYISCGVSGLHLSWQTQNPPIRHPPLITF